MALNNQLLVYVEVEIILESHEQKKQKRTKKKKEAKKTHKKRMKTNSV